MVTDAQSLAVAAGDDDTPMNEWPLSQCVASALSRYFDDLDGETANGLYAMVMDEVERPMLEAVMTYSEHNQTRASKVLGINRGTLRKKLAQYGID